MYERHGYHDLASADEVATAEADHEVTEEVVVLMSARGQDKAREQDRPPRRDQASRYLRLSGTRWVRKLDRHAAARYWLMSPPRIGRREIAS